MAARSLAARDLGTEARNDLGTEARNLSPRGWPQSSTQTASRRETNPKEGLFLHWKDLEEVGYQQKSCLPTSTLFQFKPAENPYPGPGVSGGSGSGSLPGPPGETGCGVHRPASRRPAPGPSRNRRPAAWARGQPPGCAAPGAGTVNALCHTLPGRQSPGLQQVARVTRACPFLGAAGPRAPRC